MRLGFGLIKDHTEGFSIEYLNQHCDEINVNIFEYSEGFEILQKIKKDMKIYMTVYLTKNQDELTPYLKHLNLAHLHILNKE